MTPEIEYIFILYFSSSLYCIPFNSVYFIFFFFFQAEDGIRDIGVTGVQTCALPILIQDAKQLLQSLRSGGYVIVVRHGATFSNQADTDPFNLDNIAKQRNLNEKGKELAQAFGNAMRQVGISVGKVYTSKFNRAYETADLARFENIEKTRDLTDSG